MQKCEVIERGDGWLIRDIDSMDLDRLLALHNGAVGIAEMTP
jgi:hypothetical protein